MYRKESRFLFLLLQEKLKVKVHFLKHRKNFSKPDERLAKNTLKNPRKGLDW